MAPLLLAAQLPQFLQGGGAAVEYPLLDRGDPLLVHGGEIFLRHLLEQPGQADGGAELVVSQEGDHVGPLHGVQQDAAAALVPVDAVPQQIQGIVRVLPGEPLKQSAVFLPPPVKV